MQYYTLYSASDMSDLSCMRRRAINFLSLRSSLTGFQSTVECFTGWIFGLEIRDGFQAGTYDALNPKLGSVWCLINKRN